MTNTPKHENISLVGIASEWADSIKNGRDLRTVLKSIRSETDELEEEIALQENGDEAGSDGVFGEAVDIIASALDAIRMVRPNTPIPMLEREVALYLDAKCAKWARKVEAGEYK